MSLRLIGAGFGRTGTTSLKAALEELGFVRCYHMQECFRHSADPPIWHRAALGAAAGAGDRLASEVPAGEAPDWQSLFDGYQATVDWPGCSFYKELMEVYPDAKVLLSVRDPDRWYESTRDTIYRMPKSLLIALLSPLVPHLRRVFRMVDALVWQGTFGGRFEDRERAIATFKRHNEEVVEHVPPDRLLVYEVKQGWEPLCRFLEVPVPEGVPFPHLNDAKQMQRVMRWGPYAMLALACLAIAGLAALLSI